MPARYLVKETTTKSHLESGERNVVESDATVAFTYGPLAGAAEYASEFAKIHGRPFQHISVPSLSEGASVGGLVAFVRANQVKRLNVTGAPASKAPGIHAQVYRFLGLALDRLGFPDPESQSPTAETGQPGTAAAGRVESLPWCLSVDAFCELHSHRHRNWTVVVRDPSLSDEAREFLLTCLPVLKADAATLADVLPGGTDLLTFLCRHRYAIQIRWLATRLDVHISINDAVRSTSFVHEFDRPSTEPLDPLGDEFDELMVKHVLGLKFLGFE